MPGLLHLVVPDGIDEPRTPSGGNTYDRRVRDGLRDLGWTVHQHPVTGSWPTPAADSRVALARTLDAVPDGELVLVDGLVGCGVPDVLVPRADRARLVVLVHLPLGDELGRRGIVSELADREGRVLRAARAVVATSPWAARRVVEVHGLPADRVRVVPPGVDAAAMVPGTDGRSALLCVGAVTPTKGQDVLVEALALLPEPSARLTWRCDLVGPLHRAPDFVTGVRRAIGRHRLADRVRLTGPLPAGGYYSNADLLVLPSRAETYGMVITEALARGIPVLASAVGGVPETLGRASDGQVPGLLVPPDDAEALASALRRWFDGPGLRTRLRAAAGRRRETLDGWEVTSRCLADLLTRLG